MANQPQFKYDVAISFLKRDEPVALELHTRLSEHLKVFVFSKRQEEIAGTDGVESLGNAFRYNARLLVVLYRDGWGETPWTRIEKTAITDRVLADGWNHLFFVVVDAQAIPPRWLPESHIRFNLADYGLEQAAGAIKARLQELGGTLRPLDVLEQARLVEQRVEFYAERDRLFKSDVGVKAVQAQVVAVYVRIKDRFAEIGASTQVNARVGVANQLCIVTDGRISLRISWQP